MAKFKQLVWVENVQYLYLSGTGCDQLILL